MDEVESRASVFTALRSYPDDATRALLVLHAGGADDLLALEDAFDGLGARPAEPEAYLPVDLPTIGTCMISSGGVDLFAGAFAYRCRWGVTSAWWRDAALADGSVYVGLLDAEQRRAVLPHLAALKENSDRLPAFTLPVMPFLRFEAKALEGQR